MIRNRLAILLAERGISISELSREVKISRQTLTGVAQNDTKMIQLDTLNALCKFLEVTPDNFFDYVPFDFKFSMHHEDDDRFPDDSSWSRENLLASHKMYLLIGCESHKKTLVEKLHYSIMKRSIVETLGDEEYSIADKPNLYVRLTFGSSSTQLERKSIFQDDYLSKMSLGFTNVFYSQLKDYALLGLSELCKKFDIDLREEFGTDTLKIEVLTPFKTFQVDYDVEKMEESN